MGGFTGTLRSRCRLLGSFSNNDGDHNENVKKDVKMPNFTFYGRLKQGTTRFSFFKLECGPQEINSREICLH